MTKVRDFFSIIAAAKYLNTCRTMIYYWVEHKQLKFRVHPITEKKYFLRKDLDKLKEKITNESGKGLYGKGKRREKKEKKGEL